jgi:hypothetical protein
MTNIEDRQRRTKMWIISIFEEKKKSRVTENILTITIQKAL